MIGKSFYLGGSVCPNCGNENFPTSQLMTIGFINRSCKCGYYNLKRLKFEDILGTNEKVI